MSTGIVFVAFGVDYARLTKQSVAICRKNTGLPIHVMTNVKGVDFGTGSTFFDKPQSDNRKVKLRLNEVTPFDLTLYVDCDAVIQRPGVEAFIRNLEGVDAVFNQRIVFEPGQPIWNIYRRCMDMFGVKKPIAIHNGGLFAFRKGPAIDEFFKLWYSMWKMFGAGREMPPLNCAIKASGINYATFDKGFFADNSRDEAVIIQHCWNMPEYAKRFGFSQWQEYKPFDKGSRNDFRFEKEPL